MSEHITKETLIGEIIDIDKDTGSILMEMGMHCLGCPAARGESLEEACMVHGVSADDMAEKINRFLEEKEA